VRRHRPGSRWTTTRGGRWASALVVMAALALTLASCGNGLEEEGGAADEGGGESTDITVRLASNDFTEQLILGDIYRQALEAAGYTVEYQARMGTREIVAPALENGDIDMYVEYAGSALTILAGQEGVTDPDEIYQRLTEYYETVGITPLEQAPMSNQNAFAVTQETADAYGTSLADVAPRAGDLVVGGPPECEQRAQCLAGVEQAYNTQFGGFQPISQGALKYQALVNNEIQVAVAFTTDGAIERENLVILEDPEGVFPPDHAVPVVRTEFLEEAGSEFEDVVNSVTAEITTEEISELNARVDEDRENPEDVAREWLEEKGLI